MNHRPTPPTGTSPASSKTVVWDRRRSPRVPPTEQRLWLGWRKERDFFVTRAGLMNISQGGALLLVGEPPLKGQPVWLRLEGPTPIEDVSAVVIETTRIGRGEYGVRISFREPFPTDFYDAAIEGLDVWHAPDAGF
jgi:hypothetical protein